MNENVLYGFMDQMEKISYDYDRESSLEAERVGSRQHDDPIPWKPLLIGGGTVGAGAGAILALINRKKALKSVLLGAGIGGAAGAALGGFVGMADRMDISDSKDVMEMDESDRLSELRSRAREEEIRRREAREDSRHRELMRGMRDRPGRI